MAYEQRPNTGSMFVNTKKETETHPDRTGTALIGGVEYWVSGWIKTGSKGQWLSLAFKPKEIQNPTPRIEKPEKPAQKPTHSLDLDESDFPF